MLLEIPQILSDFYANNKPNNPPMFAQNFFLNSGSNFTQKNNGFKLNKKMEHLERVNKQIYIKCKAKITLKIHNYIVLKKIYTRTD